MPTPAGPPWHLHRRDRTWRCAAPPSAAIDFHRQLPGYRPTPLHRFEQLDIGQLFVKDESQRLGLPAFKALGASWAIHRVLQEVPPGSMVTFVTATDGNHGRAVARFAREFGHRAMVLVPTGVGDAAIEAIRHEGAEVRVVDADYDGAVALAARLADDVDGGVLLQDTAWDGYTEVPTAIVDGYGTLFNEIDEQLADAGHERPDLVVVPTGVGSLLQAGLQHYRSITDPARTAVVSVEPDSAACVHASIAAGRPTTVGTGQTVMQGLNCGTVSALAWPVIEGGLDASVIVTDRAAVAATAALAAVGLDVGPCGAAGYAALRTIAKHPSAVEFAEHVGLRSDSVVVLLATEGRRAVSSNENLDG